MKKICKRTTYTIFLCFGFWGFGFISLVKAQERIQSLENTKKFSLSISTGYRQQDFRWSIAGTSDGKDPNVYSELIWKNLKSVSYNLNLEYKLNKKILLQASLSRSAVFSGKVSDTDYQKDNREYTSFYGLFDSNKGSAVSLEGCVGYVLLNHSGFRIIGYAGYGFKKQYQFLLDNEGRYDSNLKSTYDHQWQGVMGSIKATIFVSNHFSVEPDFTYHQVKYTAKGNWNLITDFQHPISYTHTANGFGLEPAITVNYHFNHSWELFTKGQYEAWETGKGIDILYRMNGQQPKTQFNGASSNGIYLSVGLKHGF